MFNVITFFLLLFKKLCTFLYLTESYFKKSITKMNLCREMNNIFTITAYNEICVNWHALKGKTSYFFVLMLSFGLPFLFVWHASSSCGGETLWFGGVNKKGILESVEKFLGVERSLNGL